MRLSRALRTGVWITAFCLCAHGQSTPSKDAPVNETKGLPPRATPADYETHAQAGAVTVAAEFKGHSVPTPQGTFSTEEYVAIETGLFGSPGERIKLSIEDFSLRVNGKKTPLSSQPYALIFGSLKDPEWEPPEAPESKSKSKTSIGGGGGGGQGGEPPPPPPKMPMELQRAMQQHVQKASLPEGDRALPQAGLIFFQYRGKTEKIHSLELTYAGPAGKVTLALQP
jgi:hypothetical protein